MKMVIGIFKSKREMFTSALLRARLTSWVKDLWGDSNSKRHGLATIKSDYARLSLDMPHP